MKKYANILAILAAILSNALWGSTFVASKTVLIYASPSFSILVRFSAAVLLLGTIAAVQKYDLQFEIVKQRIATLMSLGLMGYTGLYLLQLSALKHIASSQSAAIMLLSPVFTLIGDSALKRKISLLSTVTTLTGLLGASIIIFDQYRVDLSGIALSGLIMTIGASMCLGFSVIQTKSLLQQSSHIKGISVFNLTLYSLLIGTVGMIPFVLKDFQANDVSAVFNIEFWIWSMYLAVFCSVLAFLMWNWALKIATPNVVAVSMYIKTPVALGLGAILLNEKLNVFFYLGTLLIFFAIILNQVTIDKDRK